MKYMTKNIWLAFYATLFVGIVFLGVVLFMVHQDAFDEARVDQENLTKVTANSFNALLRQYEVVIDNLGRELIDDDSYKDADRTRLVLDRHFEADDAKTDFAVVLPDGSFFGMESVNPESAKTEINLRTFPATRDTFLKTLKSEGVVLGRTYYSKIMNGLVMPVRKTFRGPDGAPIFVLTMAIYMDTLSQHLRGMRDRDSEHVVYIYRDFDRYLQLADVKAGRGLDVYDYQFPVDLVNAQKHHLEEASGLPLTTIKRQGIVTSYIVNKPARMLVSTSYLKKYQLWVVVDSNIDTIMVGVYKNAGHIIAIFALVFGLIFFLFRAIHENEQRKQQELRHQATHDYLTNLHNRFYLNRYGQSLGEQASFDLFFIDMDNFKSINDSHGHDYGDKILIEISRRLSWLKRSDKDVVIRYSGDEFLLCIHDLKPEDQDVFCRSILAQLAAPYHVQNSQFLLTASLGVASYPAHASNLQDAIRYADLALYEAKDKKNSYAIFHDGIKQKHLDYAKLAHDLKIAFENNELYMVYQPQVNNAGEICGVEALVRWKNAKGQAIGPDVFIPVAEASGQMVRLGEFVVKTSLQQIRKLMASVETEITLSVNISVKQFMEEGFVDFLLATIDEVDFAPENLRLEITESIFIEDMDYILGVLAEVRAKGICVSLDDFGTGYSSLSLLRVLPIDELKIDKSFVDAMLLDGRSVTLIESIITIAKSMGIYVLAEGVEACEQKYVLEDMGCDLYQGYYYSKPLRIAELESYITKT